MIYITYDDSAESISSLWELEYVNPKQLYLDYMINFAMKNYNLVVNPHWLNEMNRKDHNMHLSHREYLAAVEKWNRFKEQLTIDEYIRTVLNGKQLEFREI